MGGHPAHAMGARPRAPYHQGHGHGAHSQVNPTVAQIAREAMLRAEAAAAEAAAAAREAEAAPGTLTLTEQTARVLTVLRDQPGRGGMTIGELEGAVAFEVAHNNDLLLSLRQNRKLEFDAFGRVRYVARYPAADRYELLRMLRQRGRDGGEGLPELPGFPYEELADAFPGADRLLSELSRTGAEIDVDGGAGAGVSAAAALAGGAAAGRPGARAGGGGGGGRDHFSAAPSLRMAGGVVRVRSVDTTKPDMLFSRDSPDDWGSLLPLRALVPLSGTLTLTKGSVTVGTSADLRSEAFRNDIIVIVGPSGEGGGGSSGSGGGSLVARSYRVSSGAIKGNLKVMMAKARRDAARRAEQAAASSSSSSGGGALPLGEGDDDEDLGDEEEGEDEDEHDNNDDAASGSGSDDEDGEQTNRRPGAAAAGGGPAVGRAPSGGGGKPGAGAGAGKPDGAPGGGKPDDDGGGSTTQEIMVRQAAEKQARKAAGELEKVAASVLAEHGILTVSVGNGVMNTGGHFSSADTAPHILRTTAVGYTHPFTSSSLALDRPWEGPSGAGFRAFKFGASGDLRVLWHESVAPGALGRLAAQAHSGAAAAGAAGDGMDEPEAPAAPSSARGAGKDGGAAPPTAASAAAAAALLTTLDQTSMGAPDALLNVLASHNAFGGSGGGGAPGGGGGGGGGLHSRSFPVDHRELRSELAKLGLDRVSPMEEGTLGTGSGVPALAPGHPGARIGAGKRRRPDKRSFTVHANTHIVGTDLEVAVKRARVAMLKEKDEFERTRARQE